MRKTNKLIFISLLVSVGLALSVLESSIPLPIPIPGAKLGLSNIVILVTLVVFGFKEGLLVAVLKSVLLMLITGSVTSFLYSLTGAVLSCIAMYITYRYFTKIFSLIGTSVIGAAFHNFGQVTVAAIILNNVMIYTYLPFLLLMSLFSGFFVGLASHYVVKNLRISFNSIFESRNSK
ncbi:MAG: Gx transporter family protein [Tissierellales bacterium]|nr:Gx transporter family protein [Tissierellales bacterium]